MDGSGAGKARVWMLWVVAAVSAPQGHQSQWSDFRVWTFRLGESKLCVQDFKVLVGPKSFLDYHLRAMRPADVVTSKERQGKKPEGLE